MSVVGSGQMSGSAHSDRLAPGRPGLVLLGIGTAAGIYSGLFGVGGGSVMVPLLIVLLAYDPRAATATSLAAITVIATAGTLTHAIYGNVAWVVAAVVAVPAIAGALVGTALQQRVPRDWIAIGLAVLLVIGAVDLLRPLISNLEVALGDAEMIGDIASVDVTSSTAVEQPLLLALAGFAAGVLGGMVGIGGGILVVPVLLYTQDLVEREAIATSLAAMIPMSAAAAARHYHYGNLRLREGVTLGVLGIVGAAIGASLAEVAPEELLRLGFALLMLLIAAQMLRAVRRDRRAAAAPDAEPS